MFANPRERAGALALLGFTAAFLLALLLLARPAPPPAGDAPGVRTASFSDAAEDAPAERGALDLNTASAQELAELPGIGPALSERIVAYRAEHGPFASVEELKNVSGIGEGKLEAIRQQITVKGDTP